MPRSPRSAPRHVVGVARASPRWPSRRRRRRASAGGDGLRRHGWTAAGTLSDGDAPGIRPSALPDVHGLRYRIGRCRLLRDLVHEPAGMYYDEGRLDSLSDRLSPLAIERGFDSLLDYYYLLKYDEPTPARVARERSTRCRSRRPISGARSISSARSCRRSCRALVRQARAARFVSGACRAPRAKSRCRSPWRLRRPAGSSGARSRFTRAMRAARHSPRRRSGRYRARAFRQLPEELRDKYFIARRRMRGAGARASRRAGHLVDACVNCGPADEVAPLAAADR